jgi:hypothetical protein
LRTADVLARRIPFAKFGRAPAIVFLRGPRSRKCATIRRTLGRWRLLEYAWVHPRRRSIDGLGINIGGRCYHDAGIHCRSGSGCRGRLWRIVMWLQQGMGSQDRTECHKGGSRDELHCLHRVLSTLRRQSSWWFHLLYGEAPPSRVGPCRLDCQEATPLALRRGRRSPFGVPGAPALLRCARIKLVLLY